MRCRRSLECSGKWGYSRWIGITYGPIPVGVIVVVIILIVYNSRWRAAQRRQRRQEIRRQWCVEAQPHASHRVIEGEHGGVEGLAPESIGDRRETFVVWPVPVDRIAEQRPAVSGGVDADLVGAPGLEA